MSKKLMQNHQEINWKIPVRNLHYIVIDDIPDEYRIPFMKFCLGRFCPVIPQEKENAWSCYLLSDYTEFQSKVAKTT